MRLFLLTTVIGRILSFAFTIVVLAVLWFAVIKPAIDDDTFDKIGKSIEGAVEDAQDGGDKKDGKKRGGGR